MWFKLFVYISLMTITFGTLLYRQKLEFTKKLIIEIEQIMNVQFEAAKTLMDESAKDAIVATEFLYSVQETQAPDLLRPEIEQKLPVQNPSETWRNTLEDIFEAYIGTNPKYVQLRIIGIDNQGRELVRVNSHGDQIIRTAVEDLQQKGKEPYFQEALAQGCQKTFFSSINLNRENGQIEYPKWKTMRAIKTLCHQNQLQGILVININMSHLFDQILVDTHPKTHFVMTNAKNEFIIHPNLEYEYGLQLGSNLVWQTIYEDARRSDPFLDSGIQLIRDKTTNQTYLTKSFPYTINHGDIARTVTLSFMYPELAFSKDLAESLSITILYTVCFFIFLIVTALLFLDFESKIIEMRDTKNVFDVVFNASFDAMILVDASGKVVDLNQAAHTLLPSAKEAMTHDCFLWTLFDDNATSLMIAKMIERTVQGEVLDTVSTSLSAQDQQPRPIAIRCTRVEIEGKQSLVCLSLKEA